MAEPSGLNKTVLVVEDDEPLREVIADTLEKEGFRVLSAGDGLSALSLAKDIKPDLIILDLILPGMSGWNFRMKQRGDRVLRAVPVVAMSGWFFSEPRLAQLKQEPFAFDGFLLKPFSLDALLQTVKHLVA